MNDDDLCWSMASNVVNHRHQSLSASKSDPYPSTATYGHVSYLDASIITSPKHESEVVKKTLSQISKLYLFQKASSENNANGSLDHMALSKNWVFHQSIDSSSPLLDGHKR